MTVPITYGPKQKWLYIVDQNPDDRKVGILLPRMSFEMINMTMDPTRKLNPIHKNLRVSDDKNKLWNQFVPVPYTVSWELAIMSKNTDDACQIVEQILPFFNDDFNFTMDLIPEIGKKYDIRINLISTNLNDAWDGAFDQRRVMIWTLNFEMKCWFFGPVQKTGVIKRIQVDLHAVPGSGKVEGDDLLTPVNSRIVITPGLTANGTPTTNSSNSIPYRNINADDDYGFCEDLFSYSDGRRYNPVTGEDVIE